MKIVYYTSGVTGSGRLVLGMAIRNGLIRQGIQSDFCIIHSAPDSRILGDIPQVRLPMESARQTDPGHFKGSSVYQTLIKLAPDILIVDLLWIPLHHFLRELPCRKIFLSRQIADYFFSYRYQDIAIDFDSGSYDRVLAIEPYPCPVTVDTIGPIIIRNRNEIMPRQAAAQRLGLDPQRKHCLSAVNLSPAEIAKIADSLPHPEHEGYQIFYTSLFSGGVFPIVDYFNAFDLLICGAGYNSFWEAIYFEKKSLFIPLPKKYEKQSWRIKNCQGYQQKENGADQLARIISEVSQTHPK